MRYCIVHKADIPDTAITGLHEITGLHGHVRFHSGNNPLKRCTAAGAGSSILVMLEAIHLESEEC